MRKRSSSPHAWAVSLALVTSFAACRDEVSHCFLASSDTAAMAAIESVWTEASGLSLTLCEDVSRSVASPADGCVLDHVVRGGGVGSEQCLTHSGGCGVGGCPFGNGAYVRGTADGAGLFGATVSGKVYLGNGNGNDPYAYPYRLDLGCDNVSAPCSVTGTLGPDGRLDVTLTLGAVGSSAETHHVLARAAPATCL